MKTDTNFHRPDPTAGELARWYPSFTPTTAAVTPPVEHADTPASPRPVATPTPVHPSAPAPAPVAGGNARHRISSRTVAAAGSAAAVTVIVAGLAVWALGGEQAEQPATAPVTTPTATAPLTTTAPRPWCDPAAAVDGMLIGNGPGGTDSGPAAILAFDFAYYVQRSGAAARAVVAPDAVGVDPADRLQSAIDTYIPAGAEHCVTIRAAAPDRFLVTLRERRTSGEEVAYEPQAITTRVIDGRHVITSIGDAA